MPRRLFALSPLEDKPVYVDVESPVLGRVLCRQIRRLQSQQPDGRIRFTEMLPGPEDCRLGDDAGERYTCELRLTAVDLAMRATDRRP